MNVLLLCLVLPLGFAVFVYDARLVYVLHHMSEEANRIAWGGLRGKVFYAFLLTFLLSCFGCTSSFALFASRDTADGSATFLFVVLNLSYLAGIYAMLHDMENVVLVCLWTIICVLTALFVYTAVAFDARSDASNAGLLVATHVCNFVSIFHVYVMDLRYWYYGWLYARDVYETDKFTG
jgi:hypothetical protein